MTAARPGLESAARENTLIAIAQFLQEQKYEFVTVSPATHARVNARPENGWAASLRDVFGWSRPFRAGLLPLPLLEAMSAAGVAAPHGEGWRSLVRASTANGLLFFHSAYPTIESDAVFFGPDTYRFIASIRLLLSRQSKPLRRVADIGCGAGPGAIVAALAQPGATVFALDINDAALRLAAVNAALAKADNVVVRHSDLLSGADGEFDLIVANPPYLLDATRRAYRHGGGDFGEGLSLQIAQEAVRRLAPGGTLLLYTGSVIVGGEDRLRRAATEVFAEAGFAMEYREMDPDVFGEELLEPAYREAERIAAVVLTAVRPA